ncbi:MAG: FG-GAP repeat protein [Ignavibacteria bacterium]|nr:FG-GAP repeat protein [Ignavibacteria bacterium]
MPEGHIYFGGNAMDNAADVILTGAAAGDYFGFSVSSTGDVNSDGYSDVIVGNNAGGGNAGRAYIYFGGNIMDSTADVVLTEEAANDYFGNSVSSAGDVNSDGYSDVVVGAPGNDAGGNNAGRAYIYFGGNAMDNTADVILTGAATGDYFGSSVSTAGDVNGDGYSDIVVGAKFNDAGGNDAGTAYIYFGGTAMDNTADVILTGAAAGDQFGYSVSSAGDVNGDGYNDIVVGALFNDAQGFNSGRAYIYFGGNAMDNISDVILTGEAPDDYFGNSVSLAGDINGDGYSDVVVGAYGNDAGGSLAGRAYLYLSSSPSVKPILNYVKDVPNDQGGKVNLKWARSGYDVIGNSLITDYSVFRSFPPSEGNFAWEEVSTITARKISFYSYVNNTPYDSTSNNSDNFFYRIRANTSDANVFWYSAILSGKSIDNIAPLMVSPFAATASGPDVLLNWQRSTAPDLLNYVLFRSADSTIDPYADTIWATATDSTLLDTSPLTGSYYYFIVAQDIHGNYSPVAAAQSPSTALNLTMFIEGFYNSGTHDMIGDTVTVYLRNYLSPYEVVDSAKEFVNSSGQASYQFANASLFSAYYISLKHRNSIETWSNVPQIFLPGITPYDFSQNSSKAYGSNEIEIDNSPIRFGIYSGDVNQDGTIDLADGSLIDNDAFNFVSGYVPTDVNGDEIVDLADAVFADNNGFNFVGKITP